MIYLAPIALLATLAAGITTVQVYGISRESKPISSRTENNYRKFVERWVVDRLVDGTWMVWDGTGNVWEFGSKAEAEAFVAKHRAK